MSETLSWKKWFWFAVAVYALTRFLLLPEYPIYFFTDEAVLTLRAEELVKHGFCDAQGRLFPAYFSTGFAYNTSLAVYLQIPGYLLFGKSVWATRGTTALMGVFGAIGTALLLRDGFRCRHYWLAPLFLAAMPGWFLHSRTAFDPVLTASLYPWFLYFYLRYLERGGWNLIWSVLFGAATFYSYSAGQATMVFSGLLLGLSDARHHARHWRRSLAALAVVALCAVPYLRFRLQYPEALTHQLTLLNSYWVEDQPFADKLARFGREYLYGLDPHFWFVPDEESLGRHQMKGYAHIMPWGAPLLLAGLGLVLFHFRRSSSRTVLIAIVVAPIGAALVHTGIVRILHFVVPAAVLMTLAVDWLLGWPWFRVRERWICGGMAAALAAASLCMMRDALVNGPLWYREYGLYGMQWGARQLLGEAIPAYVKRHPPGPVYVASSWANGADFLLSFFEPGKQVRICDVGQFSDYYREIPEGAAFVMTASQYNEVRHSPKFKPFMPDFMLNYPDDTGAFYFAHLRYVEDIKEQFAQEREARRQLLHTQLTLLGQKADVGYSAVDMGSGPELFDGNTEGIVRGREANPYVVEVSFPAAQPLTGAKVYLRDGNYEVTALLYEDPAGKPRSFVGTYRSGEGRKPEVELKFPGIQARRLRVEIRATDQGEIACVHLYEIQLNP